jgi:hypothetical protein
MKAKVRRARKIRRVIKKIAYLLVLAGVIYITAPRLYQKYPIIEGYFKRFGIHRIDVSQVGSYYDLLSENAQPSKDLLLGLGIKEDDDLQLAVDRLKDVMGLRDYTIWLSHHDAEKPPAYIKQLGYGDMGIMISTMVKERREILSLLVHELGHIYVWRLDKAVFGKCDEEKLVDCTGVFLGLGVLMLNGLTDEMRLMPSQEYETRKKVYGYLTADQFGYLLAKYCADRDIDRDAIKPFLNSAGWKYFNNGFDYLRKINYAGSKLAESAVGIHWCPKCGALTRFSLAGKIKDVRCAKCKTMLRE